MELREKPGKVQKLLELSLRFRLIFVVLMVGFAVAFLATGWQQMGSLPLGASEALGMWIAGFTNVVSAWNSSQYIFVAALSMVVLYFVFGGVRGGVGGLIALAAFAGIIFGAIGLSKAKKFIEEAGQLYGKAKVGKYLSLGGLIGGCVLTGITLFYVLIYGLAIFSSLR